jgi:hypothetical protein
MVCICKYCKKEYSSQSSRSNHIKKFHQENNKIIDNKLEKKFICDKCDKNFKNLDEIKNHNKNDCRPSIKSDNIYKFKTDTFGKNKYKDYKGGDIYIIQTEFNLKGFYKIGISTNLYNRLSNYRCGSVLEPKLHYYYPCKNIKETDKILKSKLKQFNIKREIYQADNINDLRNTIKEVQKESKSLELEIVPENKECDIIPCNYCDIYFTNKQDFLIHIEKNHKIEYELDNKYIEHDKFKCTCCDKTFTRTDSLTRHINKKRCKIKNDVNQLKYLQEELLKMKTELNELKQIVNKITTDKQIEITD